MNKTYLFYYSLDTLLYKAVRVFCLKLNSSITTEPIGFSILGKLNKGPVNDFRLFQIQVWEWFKAILHAPSNTEPLDSMGVTAGIFIKKN